MFTLPPQSLKPYAQLTASERVTRDGRIPDPEIGYTGLDLLTPAASSAGLMDRYQTADLAVALDGQKTYRSTYNGKTNSRLNSVITGATGVWVANQGMNATSLIGGFAHAMPVVQAVALPLAVLGPIGSLMTLAAWLAQMEISRGAHDLLNDAGGLLSLQSRFSRDLNFTEQWWVSRGVQRTYLIHVEAALNFTVQQYQKKSQEGVVGNPLNMLHMTMDIVNGAVKRLSGTKGEKRRQMAENIREWAIWETHAWRGWPPHDSGIPGVGCPTYFLLLLSILMGTSRAAAAGDVDPPPKPTQLLAMPQNEAVSVIAELLKRKGSIDFI